MGPSSGAPSYDPYVKEKDMELKGYKATVTLKDGRTKAVEVRLADTTPGYNQMQFILNTVAFYEQKGWDIASFGSVEEIWELEEL
jgi:hypothetical protein